MENQININWETCTLCGLCEEICPIRIMKKDNEGGIPLRLDRLPLCIKCGQCMAVCPFQSINVVQDTAAIRRALPEMIEFYDGLVKAMSHPIGRFFVRRKAGVEKFKLLEHHVVPLIKSRLPESKQGVEDTITRYAP